MSFPEGQEEHPLPKKLTLDERADTPERTQKLAELMKRAEAIADRLAQLYGSTPTDQEVREASGRVLEDLVALSKDAREFSRQYRGFTVGAAVLGLREGQKNPWAVLFDANTKAAKEDAKWCAEQYLMDRATGPGEALSRILAFVVVAEPQTDDDSKRTQITLTPCKHCRDRMGQLAEGKDAVLSPETEVITADARQTALRKFQRVKDLKVFHREYIEVD